MRCLSRDFWKVAEQSTVKACTWLPQSLTNLENVHFVGKSVKTWRSKGKQLKKRINQGKSGNNFRFVFVLMVWIPQYDIVCLS